MIDPDALRLLRCPETHAPLHAATDAELARLNEQIAAGAVKNRSGKIVAQPLGGALVTDNRKFVYPIRNDIPVLVAEEAIAM